MQNTYKRPKYPSLPLGLVWSRIHCRDPLSLRDGADQRHGPEQLTASERVVSIQVMRPLVVQRPNNNGYDRRASLYRRWLNLAQHCVPAFHANLLTRLDNEHFTSR